MANPNQLTYSAGIATAYGAAVRGGYTGTYEQFCALMADYATIGEQNEANAKKSEGYAVGEQNGVPVTDGPYYQNNAKYYKEQADADVDEAADEALKAEGYAVGEQDGEPVIGGAYYQNNAKYYSEQAAGSATTAGNKATEAGQAQEAAETAQGKAEDAQEAAETAQGKAEDAQEAAEAAQRAAEAAAATLTVDSALSDSSENPVQNKVITEALNTLTDRVSAIEEADGLRKYGVSGVGGSAAALTRLWDSVGMTAQVGTDGDNSSVVNSFDNVTPFNRRKCVGKWHLVDGRAQFSVHAYYGEDGYTEDGTAGDYVAVECPLAYYVLQNGVLGVSAHQWPGWRPFDIFCHNHNVNEVMQKVYLPAYALAVKDGHAVSLPGLDNYQGSYKDNLDAARSYDGDGVEDLAILQPMAVNFYEWALFTVEFATQNCQSVMNGCCNLRHSADDRVTLRSDGKWLTSNYYAGRVVGEYISIQDASVDVGNPSYYASHRIAAITRCDAEGNASASGAYQLIETDDLGLGRTYEVGTEYRIAARPYRTGSCSDVSTPSGSPVSNTDGYYPMRYRWRENVFANQYKTIADLFNKRVGTDDTDWMLEWYYLPDPASYTPSSSSEPDETDLATDAFIKLDVSTPHANYANGYVKSKLYAEEYPDVWIPGETSGSASTYYCDYATLVTAYTVRACRVGGNWSNGGNDGFSSLSGSAAPSHSSAFFGGDLFFAQ